MSVISGKGLWSIICGQSVLASDEVVGEELQNAAEHLQNGLSLYKPWRESDHQNWISKSKLKKQQQDFVFKIGKMIDVTSEQAWEVFQLFLQYDYKGSTSQLLTASTNDREENLFLLKIFHFFMTDSLHLLSCRRHILAADSQHPYQNLFKEYIKEVFNPDHSLGASLLTQLKELNNIDLSQKNQTCLELNLPLNSSQVWVSHYLSAIKHQLATLLILHGSPSNPCPEETVVQLLQLAQNRGIGRKFLENLSLSEKASVTVHLEAIDAFLSFLLTMIINADSDPNTNSLCSDQWLKRINPLIFSLGSKKWHHPPILAWAILLGRKVSQMSGDNQEATKYSRLAERAIKGEAFKYLQDSLKIAAFETDHLLLALGGSVAYSLLCIVGTCLDFEKLDLVNQASSLAQICLSFTPPSYLFWNEQDGGASVLLPSALDSFPYKHTMLLGLTTSLASANEFSAGKVVQLMKDLESFTWPISANSNVTVSGNQCIARESLHPVEGIVIPKGSVGLIVATSSSSTELIVCWQIPINGWQVLLSLHSSLLQNINAGLAVESWHLDIVVASYRLVSAVIKSSPQHLPMFLHMQQVAQSLLLSVSQGLKPNYLLVSSLFEFLAQVSTSDCKSVWTNMEGCSLLPSLPPPNKKTDSDVLFNYRPGSIRVLICGQEASSGTFHVLKNLCALLESALKNSIWNNHVRGTLVFVIKEVLPELLQWRYENAAERVSVIDATFSIVHHALEEERSENLLRDMVVGELSNSQGGAGATLRKVLEGGAYLESTLDQPAEWPHSSHASKLTRMAQLALSVTHRLVGHCVAWSRTPGNSLNEFFLGGSGPYIPGGLASPHLALTIAQFVHHRLNPRLPYLAVKTLTSLSKELGVPLVACFGSEAEGLRDCLLTRLDSATEDLWVKVAILRLLTSSTLHQPGLIRLFLSPPETLLDSVMSIVDNHKQNALKASGELLAAATEMLASLWEGNFGLATSYLKQQPTFWDTLSYCMCKEPGSVCDSLVGNILKVYSIELFNSDKMLKSVEKLIDPSKKNFNAWFEYVFLISIEKQVEDSSEDCEVDKSADLLLQSACNFLSILLVRSESSLLPEQQTFLGEKVAEGLLILIEGENKKTRSLLLQLSEMYFTLLNKCGKTIASHKEFRELFVRLLGCLCASVSQTETRCQTLLLAGALKAIFSIRNTSLSRELAENIVSSMVLLVEQHSSLASNDGTVLALSCSLLHQTLLNLPTKKIESTLDNSYITYSLIQAASHHTQLGNSVVAKEILSLLSLFGRQLRCPTDLTAQNLALSVSLVLSSQINNDILCDLLWCTKWCLQREGAAGIEGAVSLAAVHLPELTSALCCSDTEPNLCLATASFALALVPYHQVWRVSHQQCFEQIMLAMAACIHHTVKMLHLKETLERESLVVKSEGGNSSPQSLINKLLHILCYCLQTMRHVSPDLVDLLCRPYIEMNAWCSTLIQPSIRKVSTEHVSSLPNLSTLAAILDLYHVMQPKSKGNKWDDSIDIIKLNQCVEEALHLLISHCALIITNPETQPREARDVRTYLIDETASFFNHWLGRKSSSPLPPSSPSSANINLSFLFLCRQIITSLCNVKKV